MALFFFILFSIQWGPEAFLKVSLMESAIQEPELLYFLLFQSLHYIQYIAMQMFF